MPDPDFIAAHKHSCEHRAEIEVSDLCGCFYCKQIYAPAKIGEWIDEGNTALCPICGVDSVIGSSAGYPISEQFLEEMRRYWFWAS